jgi:hypothetical protein
MSVLNVLKTVVLTIAICGAAALTYIAVANASKLLWG